MKPRQTERIPQGVDGDSAEAVCKWPAASQSGVPAAWHLLARDRGMHNVGDPRHSFSSYHMESTSARGHLRSPFVSRWGGLPGGPGMSRPALGPRLPFCRGN